jgi:hypothetical protein
VIDSLELGGTLAPGDSAGMTSVTGDYTQAASAALEIEIGGTTAISQFDLLAVGGIASLAGTLSVSLLEGFTPAPGDMFEIIVASGGVSGTFAETFLPTLDEGLLWSIDYLASSVLLAVAMPGLPGDFNEDGQVDAADYIVWRIGLGTTYTQADYDVWLANFGQTSGGGASIAASFVHATVPEPAALTLAMVATVLLGLCRRKTI